MTPERKPKHRGAHRSENSCFGLARSYVYIYRRWRNAAPNAGALCHHAGSEEHP